jgi:arylsulfatase A-like enzyme
MSHVPASHCAHHPAAAVAVHPPRPAGRGAGRPSRTGRTLKRGLLIVALVLTAAAGRAGEPRPDIILVLADDLGWGDLGCYGGSTPTPHLDRMAAEGTRFTQAYVASPICSPSRCGLLTGQHPVRWRITSYLQDRAGNRACGQADFLDPAAPTLPRLLQAAGYATAHVGKWHLGGGRDVDDAPPFAAYGYDLGLGTYESPEPHPELTATRWIWSPKDPVKRWDRTRWMVDRTISFLDQQAVLPCFVNLWLDDTHTPWVPTAEDQAGPGHEAPQRLRGVIEEMDRQVGRLLDHVRARGRPTLVVFLGDNGPLPTFKATRAGGLRGSKLSLYEGGVRVPFIAWGAGLVEAGRSDARNVVSALDLLPTCCRLAGVTPPAGGDGIDISAALHGGLVERGAPLYFEYGRNPTSFRYPPAKDRSPPLAMRIGRWKFLAEADGSGAQLYDLEQDPNETADRAAEQPQLAAQLGADLRRWWGAVPP